MSIYNPKLSLTYNACHVIYLCMYIYLQVPGVLVQDRKCRLRVLEDTFVGVEAVEWLIAHDVTKNVRGAIILGNRMMKHGVFEPVTENIVGFQNDWVNSSNR